MAAFTLTDREVLFTRYLKLVTGWNFGVEVRDVALNGAYAENQPCSDLRVAASHGNQAEGLKLTGRKMGREGRREENTRRLSEAGEVRTLTELGGELGLTPSGAKALLKRLGMELHKPPRVEAQCRKFGHGFELAPRRLKQANATPLCPSCLQARRERVTVTCLRCRNSRELPPSQAEDLARPFCRECWNSRSPQERRSWRLPRRRRG